MNERIQELELEAIAYADSKVPANNRYNDIYHAIVRGKFAELLVKKCADYADMAQDADCEYLGDAVAEYMGYGDEEGVANWRAK